MNSPQIKIDGTVNLPMVFTIIIAVAAGSMWVATVNNKLDNMTQLIVNVGNVSARLDKLQVDVLRNQELLQHNKPVLDTATNGGQ